MAIEQLDPTDTANRLNQVRLSRALALLSPLQRHLVILIPYLFHYHHYRLPGYSSPLVPCGIWGYQNTPKINTACKMLNIDLNLDPSYSNTVFEGIYTMGSTASFGQNPKSDIDIWLVHDSQLTQIEIAKIRAKADKLTRWFAEYKLEVNFYLVNPNQFTCEKDSNNYQSNQLDNPEQALGHEHSGSSQHWLLLEEFYRTQICLCGKQIAWWTNNNQNHHNDDNLLCLGDVHQLPASEYLGAALWHLYKGLGKPHKSLLKVILLEAYASEYPNTQLISDTLWQRTLTGDFSAGNDPYYLLYQHIENYLIKHNDLRRLELVRRCFYLKCGIKLTKPSSPRDWRHYKFHKLVTNWNWKNNLLETLDNCEQWHSGQLQWFNQQLNELMLGSYQTLQNFASNQQLNTRMRADELGMLSRKLHTHFNQDKNQILKLNLLWSENVAENELVIKHNTDFELIRIDKNHHLKELIYQSDNLAAVVFWACINAVATHNTRWYVQQQSQIIPTKNITLLCNKVLNELTLHHFSVSKHDLFHPWYFKQILFILNLKDDPTQHWLGQEIMVDRMNANVFSLGRKQLNMLESIDVISLNSWGEYHCYSFCGELSVLGVLSFITPGLRRSSFDNIQLSVISHSVKLKSQLEHTVINLIRQTARLCHHKQKDTMLLQPLLIGKVRYGLFFSDQGLSWQDLSDTKSLYQQFFKGYLVELPKKNNEEHPLSELPSIVQLYATLGVTQYFLSQQGKDVAVFVLDEKNQLHQFIQQQSNVATMVTNVSHRYVFSQHHSLGERFNMPQFYHLDWQKDKPTVTPFGLVAQQSAHEF